MADPKGNWYRLAQKKRKSVYCVWIIVLKYGWIEGRNVNAGREVRLDCCLSQILFNLRSEYLTKEPVEGLGGFRIGEQVIRNVR
jgi:hypothetical protein